MGDLHSIAGCTDGLYSPSLGRNFHNFGVFHADMSHFLGNTPPSFHSPRDSDLPTGYLQDALFEFSSKRRRLQLFSNDQTEESTLPIESYWNSSSSENFCLSQINNSINSITGVSLNSSKGGVEENETSFTEMPTPRVSTQFVYDKENQHPTHPTFGYGTGGVEKRKKRGKRVVYPFGVVKPGGIEGEVTLEDINRIIVKPPTRPVRHPVGEFACRPILHSRGTGFSGEVVVALTTIQTRQGRGTITIIRTKG